MVDQYQQVLMSFWSPQAHSEQTLTKPYNYLMVHHAIQNSFIIMIRIKKCHE